MRAIQAPLAIACPRFLAGSTVRCCICPVQDIACKTLPYVFARKGLLPLSTRRPPYPNQVYEMALTQQSCHQPPLERLTFNAGQAIRLALS